MYEALIAEKMDSIEEEIKRMSSALDVARTRDNAIIISLFNAQLAKYYSAYHRLYSGLLHRGMLNRGNSMTNS